VTNTGSQLVRSIRRKELKFDDWRDRLCFASRLAAARELFAETGLDLRGALHRLIPANLVQQDQVEQSRGVYNQFQRGLTYFLFLCENDCLTGVKTHDTHDNEAQVGSIARCEVNYDVFLTSNG
jgi:8-oxo-dGTP pyrophosphatase MutT (NUDIX family)